MMGLTYMVVGDLQQANELQFGIEALLERPRRLQANPPPHAAPSMQARYGAAVVDAVKYCGCLVLILPLTPMSSLATVGIALGLGRKVFICAPDHNTFKRYELPLFHLGYAEEGAKPLHPSAPQIVIGDLPEMVHAVTSWWATHQAAVQHQAASITGASLEFQGGGRTWETRLAGVDRAHMLSTLYGDPPSGERHLIILDVGETPSLDVEQVNEIAALIEVEPLETT